MTIKTIKTAALLLLTAASGNSIAQTCHNLYPYADGVVYDNNGHDLNAFIKSNKDDAKHKGEMVKEYSNGTWGYLQIKNTKVPSLNTSPDPDLNKKVNLNYSEYIDATLALCNTIDGLKATWWSRQCNNPLGPLVYTKTDDKGKLDIENIKYTYIIKELETKHFTIVEYSGDGYNERDYEQLLKNYLLVENGTLKNGVDYKTMIEFYDNFLTKFTYVEDPLLENKSFITFFSGNKTKYVGYFNIVNHKLAGHVEAVDLQFEKDKDALVNNTFKKLTGNVVYVYGDDIYGLEKTMLKYGHTHNLKLNRRNTTTTEKFNEK